jgi:hypothetical protein
MLDPRHMALLSGYEQVWLNYAPVYCPSLGEWTKLEVQTMQFASDLINLVEWFPAGQEMWSGGIKCARALLSVQIIAACEIKTCTTFTSLFRNVIAASTGVAPATFGSVWQSTKRERCHQRESVARSS